MPWVLFSELFQLRLTSLLEIMSPRTFPGHHLESSASQVSISNKRGLTAACCLTVPAPFCSTLPPGSPPVSLNKEEGYTDTKGNNTYSQQDAQNTMSTHYLTPSLLFVFHMASVINDCSVWFECSRVESQSCHKTRQKHHKNITDRP